MTNTLKDKGRDISEIQKERHDKGVQIVRDIRNKADYCHNNNGHRTSENWENMSKWLVGIADRLEYGLGYRRTEDDQ